MSVSGDNEFKDFKTVLFLSVDIVGSTDYKHKTSKTQEWVKTFTTFYEKFPEFLRDSIKANKDHKNSRHPKLWKPVGDELIFETVVETVEEIQSTVKAFQDSIREYKKEAKDYAPLRSGESIGRNPEKVSLKDLELDLKGSCFTAVVPFPDMPLDGEQLEGRFKNEYIGPGIDTGFRILSKAKTYSFTVSVEVAYAFAATLLSGPGDKADEKLFEKSGLVFVEYLNLKGVWRGAKYPVFALEEKMTTNIQDKLDKRFDNSPRVLINHGCTFYDIKRLLEDVLIDEELPAFLWLKDQEHLQKTVRELYLQAKPVEENESSRGNELPRLPIERHSPDRFALSPSYTSKNNEEC